MAENRESLRLEILIRLFFSPAYTSNQEKIRAELFSIGIVETRDSVRKEMAWLDNVDAVINRAGGGVFIATLTAEGFEHLEGARAIPGIQRPRPEQMGL